MVSSGKNRTPCLIQTPPQGMAITMNAAKTVLIIDGETGLRLVREHHPGIVSTNLKKPGKDGLDVLKKIKKTAPATEVMGITGHGDMDPVVRALNLDATDVINAPIGRIAPPRGNLVRRGYPFHPRNPVRPAQRRLTASLQRALDPGETGILISFDNFSAVNETGTTRVAPCVDTVGSAISATKKTSRCKRTGFAHGTKNKLAVSNPYQYKNDKHLRLPMNSAQSRKVEKNATAHDQQQFVGEPPR